MQGNNPQVAQEEQSSVEEVSAAAAGNIQPLPPIPGPATPASIVARTAQPPAALEHAVGAPDATPNRQCAAAPAMAAATPLTSAPAQQARDAPAATSTTHSASTPEQAAAQCTAAANTGMPAAKSLLPSPAAASSCQLPAAVELGMQVSEDSAGAGTSKTQVR